MFGQGIGSGIANFAQEFDQAREKKKMRAARGKAADAFYKATPEFQKHYSAEDWSLLSPDDKAAAMEGGLKAQAFAEGQTLERERMLRMKAVEDHLADTQSERENQTRFSDFANEVSQMGQRREDMPQVLSPEEMDRRAKPVDFAGVMGAAARSRFRPKMETIDDIIRAANAGKGQDWEALAPHEGRTTSGVPYVYGKSGQFQFVPGGAGVDSEAKEVRDSSGKLLGHNVPTGGGKSVFRPVTSSEVEPFVDPTTKKLIPGVYMLNGKKVDIRTAVEKSGMLPPNATNEQKRGIWDSIASLWGGGKPDAPPDEDFQPGDDFKWDPATNKLVPRPK